MKGELLVLKPTGGASLAIPVSRDPFGDEVILDDADWGDQIVEASLAEGKDVIGAIPGARQRRAVEAVLTIQVHGATAAAYTAAVNRLSSAWEGLAQRGGLIERQVTFSDGTTVPFETEVTQAHLDLEEGWYQSHFRFGRYTLTLTRQPYWLTDEELVAQLTANTANVRELTLSALSGNLPGPARLRIEDTTNRIANSSFETDTAGWAQSGTGTTTLTRVTTESYLGVASLEVDTDGTAADQGAVTVPSLDVAASTRHTAVAWVKAPAGAQRKIILQERDASDAFVDNVTVTFTGTGDWQRVEVSNTFGATGTKARVLITTNGTIDATFHIDRVMLDVQARRTAFISQNWTYPSEQIFFLGNDAASDPGQGTVVGTTVELSPVAPAWQTVYALDDLAHRGSFKVRTRAEWAASEQITMRCLYRIGNGSWREAAKPVVLPTSSPAEAWEIDLGSVHHHSDGSLDLRVQVYADAVNATDDFVFHHLTVEPTEGYAVARGIAVVSQDSDLLGYDPFDTTGALSGQVAPLGGTWAEAGDVSPQWNVFGPEVTSTGLAYRTGAADSGLNAGGFALLGATAYADVTATAALLQQRPTTNTKLTLCAVLARYVDTSNYLVAGLRGYRDGSGAYRSRILVRKVVAGSGTDLALIELTGGVAVAGGSYIHGNLALTVRADGTWELAAGTFSQDSLTADNLIASGADSALATGGVLDDGRIGIYHADTEGSREGDVNTFMAFAPSPAEQATAVVREDGIGEFSIQGGRRKAITAETDNTLPAPIPSYQGSGLWLPPGDSRLALRLHPNDLAQEPATDDYDGSADVALYRRAAWVTLPDALE